MLRNPWSEQRNISPSEVAQIAADMKAGRYRLSPDCLLILNGKFLANGQHRLKALVLSGKGQWFLVMYSKDEQLYKVLDCGRKRTVADAIMEAQYSRNIPAAARWVVAYDEGLLTRGIRSPSEAKIPGSGDFTMKKKGTYARITQVQMINYCKDHMAEFEDASKFVATLYFKSKLMLFSIGAAIHVIGRRAGYLEQTEEFLKKVYVDGGNDAAGTLRNKLIMESTSRKPGTRHVGARTFAVALKALKAYIEGRTVKNLRWEKKEPLPKL